MAPPRQTRTRLRTRLLVGLVLASLPITAVADFVINHRATDNQSSATRQFLIARAEHVSSTFATFTGERQANLAVLAREAALAPPDYDLTQVLQDVSGAEADFSVIEETDLTGHVRWSSNGFASVVLPIDAPWFRTAVAGQAAIGPVYTDPGGALHWVFVDPVLGPDGRTAGVIAGDVKVSAIAPLLNHIDFAKSAEILIVNQTKQLILSTRAGLVTSDVDAQRSGTLSTNADSLGAERALVGQTGTVHDRDYLGNTVFAAYTPLPATGWALIVKEGASEALASVHSQTRLAIIFFLVEVAVVVLIGLLLATLESRRLRRLISDNLAASTQVNDSAVQLSAASEELAATTSEQSAAITQTSATMEELARSFSSIADTIDRVAAQTAETQTYLGQAEADIETSSERALALSERVNDVGVLLALINEIADQTNLLALNAAIEAARAGEGGRGFAVVADEVRRLAERSKASGGDIATIVEAVQGETHATVMAMEKGAKQMQRGLALLEHVTDAASQVRLTTQQQRSATAQVVETMGQLSDASRQVTSTAQEIASAAGNLADLAGNLEA
ncbi:MAG TPA: methyl-accepting chemotaxis protein, partial [Acidimicrobiales bacterium]